MLSEVQDYIEPRVPEMPPLTSAKDWTRLANRLRADILKRVVLRGEAVRWNAAPSKVEWLDTIPGGPGYHIRKLRYEAVPGFWIPALLYEPDVPAAKMPVMLDVNGHEPSGKIAPYKQALCINQVKRGMLALNVEWIGMGQFAKPNYQHDRMNQLDLCGTSGVSPFYLSMKHGLDLLLSLPHADPLRVAVTGHSGGGWQTIFISSLDTRVTLSDPVAGYSGFRVRVRHLKDLGDSEQTPCDLATVADYLHLTAMMAPRALLLTYNANDECCFEAGYVLPTLLAAAQPVYQLFGQESRLRSHINYDPGTHNYERDNREAFYRMEGDNFYAGDASFDAREIPSDAEFKTKEQLDVPLPETNADFNSLALALSKDLPHAKQAPAGGAALRKWQQQQRAKLRAVVKAKDYAVSQATPASREEKGGVQVTYWRLRTGDAWTLPAAELSRGQPQGVTLLIADAGRRSATNQVGAPAGGRPARGGPGPVLLWRGETQDPRLSLGADARHDRRPPAWPASQPGRCGRALAARRAPRRAAHPLRRRAADQHRRPGGRRSGGTGHRPARLAGPLPQPQGRAPAKPQVRGHARDVLLRPARSVRHGPTEGLAAPRP